MTADYHERTPEKRDADRGTADTLRTILVPLDGSPTAEAVLPLVTLIAAQPGARVILLAVHQPGQASRGAIGIPAIDQRVDEEARAAMGRYLHEVAAGLRDRLPTIDMVVLQGDPSERIAAYAESTPVQLVAIASHGRGGVSRLWLGSVTDRLLRHVDVPMLVVHARAPEDGEAPPAAIQRVLVPLDGTAEAEAIFAPVTRLLEGLDVEYVLMRVATIIRPLTRAISSADDIEHELTRQREHASAYLTEAAGRFRVLAPNVTTMVTIGADPAREVLEAVDAARADIIAMTTHGRGVVGRALIGSVADKVMRASPVPVLLKRVAQVEASSRTRPEHVADVRQSS